MLNDDTLLFLSNEQLQDRMEFCGVMADRETAHLLADEIMVVALLRAADEELDGKEAAALVRAYGEVDKRYG